MQLISVINQNAVETFWQSFLLNFFEVLMSFPLNLASIFQILNSYTPSRVMFTLELCHKRATTTKPK